MLTDLDAPARQPRSVPPAFRAVIRAAAIAGTAAVIPAGACRVWPALKLEILARGAAHVAALICGSPVLATADGFALPGARIPIVVTPACSAADFLAIVAALLGWHFSRRPIAGWRALLGAVATALPLTLLLNAIRLTAVAQAHRWIIPAFPAKYDPVLHELTGAAVFVISLIGLNLVLEHHARRHPAPSHSITCA